MAEIIADVLYDYLQQEEDELTVYSREVVSVVQMYDDGWWLVRKADDNHTIQLEGLVPSNYLQLKRNEKEQLNDDKSDPEDLKRLIALREIAEEKLTALRLTVSNHENGTMNNNQSELNTNRSLRNNDSTGPENGHRIMPPKTTPRVSMSNKDNNDISSYNKHDSISPKPPANLTSNNNKASHIPRNNKILRKMKSEKIINNNNNPYLTPPYNNSSIPQVVLDPSSLQFISKIVDERISKEFTKRDHKIIEEIKSFVTDSIIHSNPSSLNKPRQNNRQYSPDESNEAKNEEFEKESKIPRLNLPKKKVNNNKNNNNDHKNENIQKLPVIKQASNALVTPQPLPAPPPINNNKDEISLFPSPDGFKYAHCRSTIFPPTDKSIYSSFINPTQSQSSQLNQKLELKYVHGYDGDLNKHGNAIKGQNIIISGDQRIIFPAAAVVVIMDYLSQSNANYDDNDVKNENEKQQSFFTGHTEDVTCLSIHPDKRIIASGQIGREGMILIWNSSKISHGKTSDKIMKKIVLPSKAVIRGIRSISFSDDGRFLSVAGIEESHIMYVYEWKTGVVVASSKAGHNEVDRFLFNPFSYVSSYSDSSDNNNNNNNNNGSDYACYTLISYGGNHVKFWSLTVTKDELSSLADNNKLGKGNRNKNKVNNSEKCTLEGSLGSINNRKLAGNTITSLFFTEKNHSNFVSNDSFIITGTSLGSILIWSHLRGDSEGWLARGRLLSIITQAHDSSIVEINYFSRNEKKISIISSGSDGSLNIWNLKSETILVNNDNSNNNNDNNQPRKGNGQSPLEHMETILLGLAQNDYIRSISYDHVNNSIIAGTVKNTIFQLLSENQNNKFSIGINPLIQSHYGKVKRLSINPIMSTIFATISNDNTLRLWENTTPNGQLASYAIPPTISGNNNNNSVIPFTAICFAPNGYHVAVGNEFGELRSIGSKSTNGNGNNNRKCEVSELKYNPQGTMLAVASKDNLIHILSVTSNYKKMAVCKGHTSMVRSIDFSLDGAIIQTSDAARELLFWEASTGNQITDPSQYCNIRWFTWTSLYGYPVQGVFNNELGVSSSVNAEDVNCLSRSPDGTLLISGGSNTVKHVLKLFSFPCLSENIPRIDGGHTSPVLDVGFLLNNNNNNKYSVVSLGGNDACIFEWNIVTI
eukprot:gene14953-20114_t